MEYLKPPTDPEKLPEWVQGYLKPQKGRCYKANQFTINGVTYPFVRKFHFAAVPYPLSRRYSMLAGLYTTRPGDLLFFFQSDPQWSNDDINSRRGLRGIFRVISEPFHDNKPIKDQDTGYEILGVCPNCHNPNANLSEKCIICNKEYPKFEIPSKGPNDPYRLLVLGCRIDIEPVVIFERVVSDERAYADMSDNGMIWIGRHDNQMGAGKGSSIRQLLPEEAVKLTRLLVTESGQEITHSKKKEYPNSKLQIPNPDSDTSADFMEIIKRKKAGDLLVKELELNYHIAKSVDNPNSNFRKTLINSFNWDKLEYFSSEFPWGYTAGEADFVCSFLDDSGKRKQIIVMEFKKDWIDDDTSIQASLYVPWVIQIMSQFAVPKFKETDTIDITPIAIGRRLRVGTCKPKPYNYLASFNSGAKVKVNVNNPIFLEYIPTEIKDENEKTYAQDLKYVDKSDEVSQIDWQPTGGVVTSKIEREWVKKQTWGDSREKAGLSRFQ